MSNIILGAALALIIAALVVVIHLETRLIRDELAANRMERADLLQRIQAPHAAVAEHSYAKVEPDVAAVLGEEEFIEKEWAESEDSLVKWDEDLLDLDASV